jgi:hypothetical protein
MNSKPVVALAEVESDLKQARAHYGSWLADGSRVLVEKYDETVGWIAWNPNFFPRKYGPIQRAILKQSFYIVYFIQEPERSVVLAVLDGRRAPAEIRRIVGFRRLLPRPPRS